MRRWRAGTLLREPAYRALCGVVHGSVGDDAGAVGVATKEKPLEKEGRKKTEKELSLAMDRQEDIAEIATQHRERFNKQGLRHF